jgi:hypothetical protein
MMDNMNTKKFNETWDKHFDNDEYRKQQAEATVIDEGTPRLNKIIAEKTKAGECMALTDWTEANY